MRLSPGFHLDGEDVIVLLEFASESELIVQGLLHLLKVSKRMAQKRVEPVGGNPLKAGGEHPAHEKVIMRIDSHLILVVPKMMNEISCSAIEVEAQHHELPWEQWEISSESGKQEILRPHGSISWRVCQLTLFMRF